MELRIKRHTFGIATLGDLFVDGLYFCHTLEDKVRPAHEAKIYGQTAIAPGNYRVIITYSNRFKRNLPLLLNVPNFEGVRIHPGNTSKDTEGCILLGRTIVSADFVGDSRTAFDKFMTALVVAGGEANLSISN